MKQLLRGGIAALAISLAACGGEPYESRAVEIFPPIPVRSAALYGMGQLPFTPAFFKGQWTIVLFGEASCPQACQKRLSLVDHASSAQKLFVITDLASHAQLKALGETYPDVNIAMGTTAVSFNNFFTQFRAGDDAPSPNDTLLFMVNPEGEIISALSPDSLGEDDMEKEIAKARSS